MGPRTLAVQQSLTQQTEHCAGPSLWLMPPSFFSVLYAILEVHCKCVGDVDLLIFFLHIQWQSRELYSVITLEDDDFMTLKI